MKKMVITLIIIMLVSFTIAGILVGIQIQNIHQLDPKVTDVNKIREIGFSERLDKITIKSEIVKNINILESDENKIKIELTGNYSSIMNRRVDIYSDNIGDKVRISVAEEGILRYVQFGDYISNLTLNVYIPRAYNKILEIKASYDNIYIEDNISKILDIREI